MEWIKTTAKSLPEAIDLALDNLGVDESEAEIVVIEEPKQGFFGRVKGVARVEARVRPKPVRAKEEKRNRRSSKPSRQKKPAAASRARKNTQAKSQSKNKPKKQENQKMDQPVQEDAPKKQAASRPVKREIPDTPIGEVSAHLTTFLSGLTKAFGYEDEVKIEESEETGVTATVAGQYGYMVGPKGRTLDAIQEIARVSTQRTKPSNHRIYVDVGGYRKKREEALKAFALQAAEKAKTEGVEVFLDPMPSADRKIVHDVLSETEGVETRSAGYDPKRKVVVVPAAIVASE